jgi:Xaa-Pro dipeptidase
MLPTKLFKRRIKRVNNYLEENDIDLLLLTPSAAFQYVTGIEREMRERLIAFVLERGEEPHIIAPAFEVTNLTGQTWIKDIFAWEEHEDPYNVLVANLKGTSNRPSVAFDERLPLGVYWYLQRKTGGYKKAESITPLLDELRLVKAPEELELMRKAGHIIDDAVTKAYREAHIGMSELEVMRIVQDEIVRQEALPTFAAIQFGENSALPHADPGPRVLQKGDLVLMDCGCKVDGINTDMTRVGVVGSPSDEQKKVHSIVQHAQETAIENIREGIVCEDADALAREAINKAGYGSYFTHRLGHGIGLEVHEPPYLVKGNKQGLKSGMTHSVEPGIYMEGKFGVRIEDLVLVREKDVEVLTYSPKAFFIIES